MTYSKLVSEEVLEDNFIKLTFNNYESGSCQCSKDCDCYQKRGELQSTTYRYTYITAPLIRDKYRQHFSTLKGAFQSYNAKQPINAVVNK